MLESSARDGRVEQLGHVAAGGLEASEQVTCRQVDDLHLRAIGEDGVGAPARDLEPRDGPVAEEVEPLLAVEAVRMEAAAG